MTEMIQTERTQLSSMEVSKTSTGKYSWSVKIYFDQNKPNASNEALIELQQKEEALKAKYGGTDDKKGVIL